MRALASGARIFLAGVPTVTKLKTVLMNPFLIGAQGFMAGVLLFYTGSFPQIA
jgi:hypothetical protein